MKIRFFIWIVWTFVFHQARSQDISIVLKSTQIEGLGGIQSYARGEWQGYWFIFGGRLDGLHLRMPFASFDVAGHNNQILMVSPADNEVLKRPLTGLPTLLGEQLSSTNMQFYQVGKYLYITGGYGYSNSSNDHITYPYLTAVDLEKLLTNIKSGTSINSAFRQVSHAGFEVTGGYMGRIGEEFYLVGGQKFRGRYNPMGPGHGPGFEQQYTDAIRKFRINDDGQNIAVTDYQEIKDPALFHKRDYNMLPQIMPDGSEGLTAFSGVFRTDADLPFLNCVNIAPQGYAEQPSFNQLFNHYHCAHVPLYDSISREMHNVFFGGIAQFYMSNGTQIKDDNVPFVRTIADVVRTRDNKMKEYVLDVEMPGYLGSGAEFFISDDIALTSNGVVRMNTLTGDTVLLGYIFGGIASTGKNIFFSNTGSQSSASSNIYKVYLVRGTGSFTGETSQNFTNLTVYPNPVTGVLNVSFSVQNYSEAEVSVLDEMGRIVMEDTLGRLVPGNHSYRKNLENFPQGTYLLKLGSGSESVTVRFQIK